MLISVGCHFDPALVDLNDARVGDGVPDGESGDALADAPIDVSPFWDYDPAGFDESTQTYLPRLVLDVAGVYEVNTGTSELVRPGGAREPLTLGTAHGGTTSLLALQGLEVRAGATLRIAGPTGLVIASNTTVVVEGVIDASAVGVQPGPGSVPCADGDGQKGGGTTSTHGAGGGGGAGYAAVGGAGGAGGGTSGSGGDAGMTQAGDDPSPLHGGCTGGEGGDAASGTSAAGGGGGGGGALQISARAAITVSGGKIKASGGGGDHGGPGASNTSDAGGGGGGSGGTIALQAPQIDVVDGGFVCANGGSGGNGSHAGDATSPGTDGLCSATRATTAADSVPSGDGGAGGAKGNEAGAIGGDGGGGQEGGGGGGGGSVGEIRIGPRTTGTLDPENCCSPTPVLTI